MQLNRSQQKFLFLAATTALYIVLVVWLDFLRGPYWWDEETFWQTSLTFSHRLIPSLDALRDYQELNTPLPFVIFGTLEYLFHQGIFAGRFFNLMLSLGMVFIVGWPSKDKGNRAILCVIGLLMCPYYLWLSGRLYTEMIACFWILMGFITYFRSRHLLSAIAFILAIASRQYMVAFPAAIATYEFVNALAKLQRDRTVNWNEQWRWLAPALAALSLLGWFYFFQGLAPESAFEIRRVPEVQQTTFALSPGGATYFLAFVGLYIVIPEFILFDPIAKLKALKQQWYRVIVTAACLLVFFIVFPLPEYANGNIVKIASLLPHPLLQIGFYYGLALLACIRFIKFDLMAFIVLFNVLIMMKAHPWDRYVLPLAVVFWYCKSVGLLDQFKLPGFGGLRTHFLRHSSAEKLTG